MLKKKKWSSSLLENTMFGNNKIDVQKYPNQRIHRNPCIRQIESEDTFKYKKCKFIEKKLLLFIQKLK